MRGRKPVPQTRTSPGMPPIKDGLPRCPPHLTEVARREWRRLASPLYEAGVLTLADRAALAAYCQAYARWVEAEEKLQQTPPLLKTPSGYVQPSPWITIANKQSELMGRYMAELGLTPASRTRMAASHSRTGGDAGNEVRLMVVARDENGNICETPMPQVQGNHRFEAQDEPVIIELDPRI